MPELIRIGDIWLNPSQIQYFRLFDRGETLILYFAGRSLTFNGKEMEACLKLIRQQQQQQPTHLHFCGKKFRYCKEMKNGR